MKDMELGQTLKIIFQSVYYRLKISKRQGLFFFRFVLINISSTKGGRKSRYFMPVEGPDFKKIFIL